MGKRFGVQVLGGGGWRVLNNCFYFQNHCYYSDDLCLFVAQYITSYSVNRFVANDTYYIIITSLNIVYVSFLYLLLVFHQ